MKNLKELKQEAKQKGIKNYSRMRKAELEELLENLPEEPYKIQASRNWEEEEKIGNKLMKNFKKPMNILKQKVDVLRKATKEVIPKKVSETIEKSVKTGFDYLKSIWEKKNSHGRRKKKSKKKKIFRF